MAAADLDEAVEGAMLAKVRNMGQACTAANRFLVHEGLADDFTRRLRVLTGGEAVGSHGWFYVPTVLSDKPVAAGLLEEEIFSPVAPIVRFSSADEAIRRANDSPYGLVAYAYTRDMSMAAAACRGT